MQLSPRGDRELSRTCPHTLEELEGGIKGQHFEDMNLLDGFIFSLVGFALSDSSTAFTVTLAHYSLCGTDLCLL